MSAIYIDPKKLYSAQEWIEACNQVDPFKEEDQPIVKAFIAKYSRPMLAYNWALRWNELVGYNPLRMRK